MNWKTIPGTNETYEASDTGEIRSLPRKIVRRSRWGALQEVSVAGQVIKPWHDNNGYAVVRICVGGKQQAVNVHRLVAMAFHGERDGLDVNHIDGNKANNASANLEWCTRSENMRHAIATGLAALAKPVIARANDGVDVRLFASADAAAKSLGSSKKASNIRSALCGFIPSAYGYKWSYI